MSAIKRLRLISLLSLFLLAPRWLQADPSVATLPEAGLRADLDRLLQEEKKFFQKLADVHSSPITSEDGSAMWHHGKLHFSGDDQAYADTSLGHSSYAVLVHAGTDAKAAEDAAAQWRAALKKALPDNFVELPVQAWKGHRRTLFYGPGLYHIVVYLSEDESGETPLPKAFNAPGTHRVSVVMKSARDWEKQIIARHEEGPATRVEEIMNRSATMKESIVLMVKARDHGFVNQRGMDFGEDKDGGKQYLVLETSYPGKPAPLQVITVQKDGLVLYSAIFAGVELPVQVALCYEDSLTPAMKDEGYVMNKSEENLVTTWTMTQRGDLVSKCVLNRREGTAHIVIVGFDKPGGVVPRLNF
jgi:hypothetical protein